LFSRIASLIERAIKISSGTTQEEIEDEDEGVKLKEHRGLSVEEKVQRWDIQKPEVARHEDANLDQADAADDDEYEDYAISHYPDAWKFLTSGHAYKWLLGRVRTEMLLTKRDGTLAENIRREILKGLASGKKENGYGQGIYRAKFKIPWTPQAFLKQQYPDEHNLQLGYIITIVGSGVDAQALTCAGYLSQVWPATGLDTLSALQEAVTNGAGKRYKCNVFGQPLSSIRH
jgi:hypothetical protein